MANNDNDNDNDNGDGSDGSAATTETRDTPQDDVPKKVKGEVKEVLGAITGDRRVEAEGRTEQRVADPAAPEDQVSDAAVGQQEGAVRQAHHDVPADSPPGEGPLGT